MPYSPPKAPSLTIAIADDHELLRKGLILILQYQGNEVIIEANSGDALLQHLAVAKKLPDLCIVDVNMPGLNGFDTVAALRASYLRQKVLALSMYTNEQSRERMMACGANGYISKDTPPEHLNEVIRIIMEHGTYPPASPAGKTTAAGSAPDARPPRLNPRERDFLRHCCTDMTYKQMAEHMNLSPRSVERYSEVLYVKLGVQSRSSLVLYALRTGLVSLE